MTETKARVWKKIIFFYLLTTLLTAAVNALDRRAPTNITLATAVMWCPALAAFVTKRVFGESVRNLHGHWSHHRVEETR